MYFFLALILRVCYPVVVASKQIWMVTIAGKQTLLRDTQRGACAQVVSRVEHQVRTRALSVESDPIAWLERYRTQRRWEKEGVRYSLVFGERILATMDPA